MLKEGRVLSYKKKKKAQSIAQHISTMGKLHKQPEICPFLSLMKFHFTTQQHFNSSSIFGGLWRTSPRFLSQKDKAKHSTMLERINLQSVASRARTFNAALIQRDRGTSLLG